MKKNKPDDKDLIRFRAEVEGLLGISVKAEKPEVRGQQKRETVISEPRCVSIRVIESHLAPGEYTGGNPPCVHGGLNKKIGR